MSGVTFRPASEVKRVADKLIPKHHIDLVDVDMRYVFRSEHAKTAGKAVFGRAKKISGLNAYLAQLDDPDETGVEGADGDFFVIEIAEDLWVELTQKQRVALVDHELCHCGITYDKDENVKLKTIPHDLEEFRSVVERHGLWMPDVALMAESMQLRLGLMETSVVEEAVQEFIDSVPEGTSLTISTSDGQTATIDKTGADSGVGSGVDSELNSEAEPHNDEALHEPNGGATDAEPKEQEPPADDEQPSSPEVDNEPSQAVDGSDAGAPAPPSSTPAQRLALGRHIAALDEPLTDEFLTWCRKTKTPPNPQHMTFDQARAALVLVGEREPAATG